MSFKLQIWQVSLKKILTKKNNFFLLNCYFFMKNRFLSKKLFFLKKVFFQFFFNFGVNLVKQSPYSPDMNMCDRYLSRILKSELKGQSFHSPLDVEKATKRCLRRISEETLSEQLQSLQHHCERVIECGGDYISSV